MRSLLIVLLILASVSVLLGVLAKVNHWPGANALLGAGLITELFCAFLVVKAMWRKRRG